MIRVSVHLISANDGAVTELARMDICNDASGNFERRNYTGESYVYDAATYIGRDSSALNRETVSKRGRVVNWPSQRLHIWNLVHMMLETMGYTKR